MTILTSSSLTRTADHEEFEGYCCFYIASQSAARDGNCEVILLPREVERERGRDIELLLDRRRGVGSGCEINSENLVNRVLLGSVA